MRVFGSLNNRIMETVRPPEPKVGDGATILMYSDRKAATIIEVRKDGKGRTFEVTVQRDNATRTDKNGMSDAQDYAYSPNPNAPKQTFSRRRNGAFVAKGDSMHGGTILGIGYRDEHYDYSF